VIASARVWLGGKERLDQLRNALNHDGWRRPLESLRARHTCSERTGVIGPNGPEQRGRVPVNEHDDLVAVLRPFEVMTEPGT